MKHRNKGGAPRGERNGRAKLTDKQRAIIRASTASSMELAKRFHVHLTTVYRVRRAEYLRVV